MSVLKIGISSRALFDLNDSHDVYVKHGIKKYSDYQRKHEDKKLQKGAAFQLVQKLLDMNTAKRKIVEVILLSRNSSETGLRIFNSIEKYKLEIAKAVFSGGESPFPYVDALDIDLFLSADISDVKLAIENKIAAAHILTEQLNQSSSPQLRIAFDADAVIFSDESEKVFKNKGLEKYLEKEGNSSKPISPGPFNSFLKKLNIIQSKFTAEKCPIRIAIVTARAAPAHKRVIKTLRQQKIRIDETFFLGGLPKGKFLKGFSADIFFDDLTENCQEATSHVSTGHVPYGINNSK
jgi:5'-nucleotidase